MKFFIESQKCNNLLDKSRIGICPETVHHQKASFSAALCVFACVVAISASFLMGGCASGQLATKEHDSHAKGFVVPPGKSLIYVYRDSTFFGAGVLTKVTLDSSLGVIGPTNFLMRVLDPGTHVVTIENSGIFPMIPDRVTVETKAGEKYFIRTWQEIGWTTNKVRQRLVTPETAEKELVRYKMVEWID